jgi:hypothetical protein
VYANAQFELSKPDSSGRPLIRQLVAIYEQTGKLAPQLANLPMLPSFTAHIWHWFCELSRTRSSGFAVQSIAWSEIFAFFSLKRIDPERWEIDALLKIDIAFMASRDAAPVITDAKALKAADEPRLEQRRGR